MMQICSQCGSQFAVADYQSVIPGHLLHTNDPPSSTEKLDLLSDLRDNQRELPSLIQTISAMERTLEALKRRRSSIEYNVRVHKGIRSVIRQFPREILAQIFLLLPGLESTNLDTTSGLWPVSRVCRIWKEAALSLSVFWTNISINFVSRRRAAQPNVPHILKTAFDNANGQTISLSLRIESADAKGEKVLDAAIQYSAQWRRATLKLRSRLIDSLGYKLKNLPALEHLSIEPVHHSIPALIRFPPNGLYAPKLRSAAFRSLRGTPELAFPFDQITHFEFGLTFFSFNETILQLLRMMPNLVFLHITEGLPVRTGSDSISNVTPVTMTHLRSLALIGSQEEFLERLTCPSLEELTCVYKRDFQGMIQLIRRSCCSIKTLRLGRTRTSTDRESLYQLINEVLPSLTTVHIADTTWANDLISGINESGTTSNINRLPASLEELVFSFGVFWEDFSKCRDLVDLLLKHGGRGNRRLQVVTFITPSMFWIRGDRAAVIHETLREFEGRIKIAWVEHRDLSMPLIRGMLF